MKKAQETLSISQRARNKGLCLEIDDFLEDKPIWVAILSNGITVYQDDNRPGLNEPCAWKRLSSYVECEGCKIIGMYLKFRSNVNHIENNENHDGYYFAYGVVREIQESKSRLYFNCGTCDGEKVYYKWYLVPELIAEKELSREVSEDDIKNKNIIFSNSLQLTKK
jgi:hypothetical protein